MIRLGVKEMLASALEVEVREYIGKHREQVDEKGHRQVVRNGMSQARRVTTSAGSVEVKAPRVNDRRNGEKFVSKVLPPYLRRSPKVESLIPALYLRGLSTGKISTTLKEYFVGDGSMGLSPASVCKLLKVWETEFEQFKNRKLTKNMCIFGPTVFT